MEVYSRLSDIRGRFANSAVALGTFDGVHVGHQQIISRAVACARKSGGASIVFTFSNHPLSVIDPDRSPPLLVTAAYREELIAALGADVLLSVAFDHALLELSPAAFIDLLVDNLRPSCIVVGPNYSFGHRGEGTPEMLADAGRIRGFEVVVPPAVTKDGTVVSSTLIRQLILAGEVAAASPLLGRPFRVSGTVSRGEGRGRTLGFPTANITAAAGQIVPADGVYAVSVSTGDASYRGVANIGDNPTFKGKARSIEAHLLGFAGDLYGRTIAVDFLAKLRDEQTFAGAEELKDQIGRDIAAAERFFK
ncbi:bifunctional riboflavin kinase/FAD synthetase [Anaeroselena agilis]|uniref:Riboflavin biosynthesis protein n=1 Tax=Anaeroselena agilis TaxID=3063788 RepID=A0ABU3NX04_9FIRM|nr:bifunctional riboflavin kinase/FAD synthetase [Selenomonadales bacterium 4137-cl]